MQKNIRRAAAFLAAILLIVPLIGIGARAADLTYCGSDATAGTEAEIYRFLTEDLGLNRATAVGILANIDSESGFSPTATVRDANGEISFGLCQWNGGRFTALRNFCNGNGLDYRSVNGQLQYMQYELLNAENFAWKRMQNIPDTIEGAYTAAYNWARYFERCWSGYYVTRAKKAASPFYTTYSGQRELRVLFFDVQGGTCGEAARGLNYGEPFGTLPVPYRDDSIFLGWYTDREGGELVSANTTADFIAGKTVYARWNSSAGFVKRLHSVCLGREADPGEITSYTTRLNNHTLTASELAARFFSEESYRLRNRSDAEFVNDLYQVLFNRYADSEGLTSWVGQINAGASRSEIFRSVCGSSEFTERCENFGFYAGSIDPMLYNMQPIAPAPTPAPTPTPEPIPELPEDEEGEGAKKKSDVNAFVERLYEVCLLRPSEPAGHAYWVNKLTLEGRTGGDVAYGFVFSQEYLNKNASNEDYVTMLYRTILGREPEQAGYEYWLRYLRNGSSRYFVFCGFCNSQEFRNLCAVYAINPGV